MINWKSWLFAFLTVLAFGIAIHLVQNPYLIKPNGYIGHYNATGLSITLGMLFTIMFGYSRRHLPAQLIPKGEYDILFALRDKTHVILTLSGHKNKNLTLCHNCLIPLKWLQPDSAVTEGCLSCYRLQGRAIIAVHPNTLLHMAKAHLGEDTDQAA